MSTIQTERLEWLPVLEQAQAQGNAYNLPKPPPGIDDPGSYTLNRPRHRSHSWVLYWKLATGGQRIRMGSWKEENGPDNVGPSRPPQARSRKPSPKKESTRILVDHWTAMIPGTPVAAGDEVGPGPAANPFAIMIRSMGDSDYELMAWGLETGELVDLLRLALIHCLAVSHGVQTGTRFSGQTTIAP